MLPVFTVRRDPVDIIMCRDEPMARLRASEAWDRGLVGWPVPVTALQAQHLIRRHGPRMRIDPYRVADFAREAGVAHTTVRRAIERRYIEALRDNPQALGDVEALPAGRYRALLGEAARRFGQVCRIRTSG